MFTAKLLITFILLNPAGGYERPSKLKSNWLEQHSCWLHCCRYLPSLLISQLSRVEQNFSASRGVWGEKTHCNLCIYIITLSCLKGSFQVRTLCQNQHLESLRSWCLRHLVRNYLRVLATFLWLSRKWCPSRSGFLALRIFSHSLVLWTDILIQSRIAQPHAILIISPRSRSKFWSRFDSQRTLLVPVQQLLIASNWWQLAFLQRFSSFSLFIK